ncbi:12808_t:CDS:2, partial [Funneliformis geosporum]
AIHANHLEEALSCIPPPITYSTDCVTSKTTTKASGDPPTSVLLWGDFFEEVNRFRFDQQPRFERPRFNDRFVVVDEEDVRNAINVNICMILNDLTGPDYIYSRKSTDTPGIPDFNCHLVGSLILVMEAKRKHVLEDMGEQTFPEFYNTMPAHGDNNSRNLRSHSKSTSSSSIDQQSTSGTFANQQSSSNIP